MSADFIIARVENGKPVKGSPDDPPVIWWSFSKTVLAAAAMALVRDGKAELDALLPGEGFSLRALLQHTSGLPNYGGQPVYHDAVLSGRAPWSEDEFLSHTLAPQIPRPEPGDFAYSSLGYLILRRWIEATAGAPIDDVVRRLLLLPMGVENVRFARTPEDLAATRWGNARNYHPGWVAHGLLIGPPVSAALFLDRLIMGPAIPAPLLKEMRRSMVVGGPIEGRPFVEPSYGLGVMMDPKAPAGRMVGHTGSGPLSSAAVYRFPDAKPDCTIAAFSENPVPDATEWACVNAAHS